MLLHSIQVRQCCRYWFSRRTIRSYLTCMHTALMLLLRWWLSLCIMLLPPYFDVLLYNTQHFLLCEHKKNPLNAIFCSAVCWWLIWLRNHTILPQQKQKGAQMNRSWPSNLPVVKKECATRFLLNSFISATLSELSFCRPIWKGEKKKKRLWRNISMRSLLKSLFPEWSRRVGGGLMFVSSWFFQQTYWTLLLVQTTARFELLAR